MTYSPPERTTREALDASLNFNFKKTPRALANPARKIYPPTRKKQQARRAMQIKSRARVCIGREDARGSCPGTCAYLWVLPKLATPPRWNMHTYAWGEWAARVHPVKLFVRESSLFVAQTRRDAVCVLPNARRNGLIMCEHAHVRGSYAFWLREGGYCRVIDGKYALTLWRIASKCKC